MRNYQKGKAELFLQIFKEIDYLGLYGHVKCRYRLIGNDELRI